MDRLAGGITIVALGVRFATMGIFLSPAGVIARNFLPHLPDLLGRGRGVRPRPRGLGLVTKDDVIPCFSYFSHRPIYPLALEWFFRPTLTKLQADLREHAGPHAVQLRSTSDR